MKSNKTITTITEPEIKSCKIQPESGLAGDTLFTISCVYLNYEYNKEMVFEYYQKNKNDKSNIGNILLKFRDIYELIILISLNLIINLRCIIG